MTAKPSLFKRLQQFWASADLGLIHHRRERRMRILASLVMLIMGVIWAIFFALRGAWGMVAMDMVLILSGLTVFTLTWRQHVRSANLVLFSVLLVIISGMAAILGLDAEAVKAGCAEAAAAVGEPVEAVNFNDPKQTVIAGTKAAVEKACEVLKAAGAKRALSLPVSAPFHSSLMKPAADKLRAKLADTVFAAAQIPLINNIDVAVQTDADRIRDALYRQAFGPVRWVECVLAIKARGITTLVECGPGKVLAGMTKRIDAELTGAALFDPATLADVKELLA